MKNLFNKVRNKIKESSNYGDDWIEIEAKSKEEALERACNALNTTKAYLEYEVIGKGGKKIRARKVEKETQELQTKTQEKEIEETAIEPKKAFDDEEVTEQEIIEDTELGQKAKETLQEILHFIEPDTQVNLTETENEICLDIVSDGSGVFIGKHGATLEAFQHVIAKIMGLDRNSKKRLVLDAEGYRSRRQESLELLAKKLASKATRERRSVSLEPMSAMDRRVIHLTLADHRDVMTKSVGEGLNRKIVVVPKNTGGRKAPNGNRKSNDRNPRRGNNNGNNGGNSKPIRLHDSFDVPPAPKMDIFPDDIDSLMDLSDEEVQERVATIKKNTKARLVSRDEEE